ncbi:hypothetical protein [Methanobacterium paludis]|uniref:Uncharacterized protein n=1 Tax=Methanobacterium paludis (strain DSM 25820 / JCM 18151 / SWAN1) TaxID=868131 RepID=F6D399_METPW|nr:hypothetical protein [Methanobacterium paludis]AEG18691.1 hypothetical protein MSWAN_1680 [Methanobacterium paludis]
MHGRPWEKREINYVRINRKQGAEKIGKHLFRSEQSVKGLARRYNISLTPKERKKTRWTQKEDEIIMENDGMPLSEVQKLLPNKRSISQISWRRSKLGLVDPVKKDPFLLIIERQKKLKGVENG